MRQLFLSSTKSSKPFLWQINMGYLDKLNTIIRHLQAVVRLFSQLFSIEKNPDFEKLINGYFTHKIFIKPLFFKLAFHYCILRFCCFGSTFVFSLISKPEDTTKSKSEPIHVYV